MSDEPRVTARYEITFDVADFTEASKTVLTVMRNIKGVGLVKLVEYQVPEKKVASPPPPPKRTAPQRVPISQQKQAIGMGFTGDNCCRCGQFRMKRNGSCLVCVSCGETTGCS